MQTFIETGDANLSFPRGKPQDDAYTLDDITDEMIDNDDAPVSTKDWVTTE